MNKSDYFIHESSYVGQNVQVGKGSKIWYFCHIEDGATIGENCLFGQNIYVAGNVKIGNYVKLQNNISVYSGVELEDYVFCGPSCVFTNDLTPRSKYPKLRENYKKTLVKEGASIGANATVVCGNTIGKCALVAAGAVVTKDVLDYSLVKGNPARHVGWVCECGERLNEDLVCTLCKRKYELYENGLRQK